MYYVPVGMHIVHGQRSKSNLGRFDKDKVLNETRLKLQSCAKSIEKNIFRPKMAIFCREGMKEGGLPLPLAFQYLIFMI